MIEAMHTLIEKILDGSSTIEDLQSFLRDHHTELSRPSFEGIEAMSDESAFDLVARYNHWAVLAKQLHTLSGDILDQAAKMRLSDSDYILKAARIASEIVRAADLPDGKTHMRCGFQFQRLDMHYDSAAEFQRALDSIPKPAEDPELEAYVVFELAQALRRDNQFDDALRRFDEFLAHPGNQKLQAFRAEALRTRAHVLSALGRSEPALNSSRDAVALRRQTDDNECRTAEVNSLANFLFDFGQIATRGGSWDEARQALAESVELHKNSGTSFEYAYSLSELGLLCLRLGATEEAASRLDEAIRIAESGPHIDSTVEHWRAVLSYIRGDQAPDAQIPALPDRFTGGEEAFMWNARSLQLLNAGRIEPAVEIARKVLDFAATHPDATLKLSAGSVIAGAHMRAKRWHEAQIEYQKLIRIADFAKQYQAAAQMRTNLAKAYLNNRQNQQAVDVLLAGMAFLDIALKEVESVQIRQLILSASLELYEIYAHVAATSDAFIQMVNITENARARNLQLWMTAAQRSEQASLARDLRVRLDDSLCELRSTEVALDRGGSFYSLSSADLNRIRSRRNSARKTVNDLIVQAGGSQIDWDSSVMNSFSSRELITQTLDPGSFVLVLFCTEQGIAVSLLQRNEHEVSESGDFLPWTRDERARDLGPWFAGGGARAEGEVAIGSRELVPQQRVQGKFETQLQVIFERFINLLVKLVTAHSPRRLIVIPHRELAILPYWKLLDDCPSIEAFTIAPSLTALSLCLSRKRAVSGPTVAVGDQTGTLPQASGEIDYVHQVRPHSEARSASTPDQLIRASADCALLHIAAHGKFDPTNPYESGILMAASDPSPVPAARLTVADCIAKLSLPRCRLTVLSTCESGVGSQHAAGELLGLPNAMLVAGAKSVIASLWPVHDSAAATLMRLFYEAWSGGGGTVEDTSIALRLARAKLKAFNAEAIRNLLGPNAVLPEGEYPFADPIYSDAFCCFGSW